MDHNTMNQIIKNLTKRKDDLLERIRMDEQTWAELHEQEIEFEERAANENLAELLEGVEERHFDELKQIEKSLQKIRVQEYGYCESCGRQISAERLHIMPHAAICMKCAGGKPAAEYGGEEDDVGALPEEYAGLDESEIAGRIMERLQRDSDLEIEELEITFRNDILELDGVLPSRRTRAALLEFLEDTLGFRDLHDHTRIDPQPWERAERSPDKRRSEQTAYEIITGGRAGETLEATDSEPNETTYDPPDELIPEEEQ